MLAAGLVLAGLAGCNEILGLNGEFGVEDNGGAPNGSGGGGAPAAGGNGGVPSDGGSGAMTSVGGGGGDGGSGGEGAMGPISGHAVRWSIDKDQTDQLEDAHYDYFAIGEHIVEALIPPAEPGGAWQSFPGTTSPKQGTFYVDGVPPGPYLLHVDSLYAWLVNRDDIDLDVVQLEQFDTLQLPSGDTPATHLSVDNMTPWTAADNLQFMVPSRNLYGYADATSNFTPAIQPGATNLDTTIGHLVFTFGATNLASASDEGVFIHMGKPSGTPYVRLLDYAEVSFSVPAASEIYDMNVTFEPVNPATSTFPTKIDTPAIEALTAQTSPYAEQSSAQFFYSVIPQPYTVQRLSGSFDLITHALPSGVPTNLTYLVGNPFDDRWKPIVIVSSSALIHYQLPGLAEAVRDVGFNACELRPDDPQILNPSTPFEIPTRPAEAAQVEGHDFFDTSMPVLETLTPTISWTTPEGAPIDRWSLRIIEVRDNGAGVTQVPLYLSQRVFADGSASSITVPPGMLEPGKFYVFWLYGSQCPDCDYQAIPGRRAIGECVSVAASEIFTMPAAGP